MIRFILTVGVLVTSLMLTADDLSQPTILHDNGGWCWFQDERAIIDGNWLITGSIKSPEGDADIIAHDFSTGETTVTVIHPDFQADDHNAPAFLVLPDGRYLCSYMTHGGANDQNPKLMRWTLSKRAGDPTEWEEPQTLLLNSGISYTNLYMLSAENNRIYNFYRGYHFNPNYAFFDPKSDSFTYAGRWLHQDGIGRRGSGRPYVKYTSNNVDEIHFLTTEDHPYHVDNSLYHGFIRDGNVHRSDGTVVGPLSTDTEVEMGPKDFTRLFEGDSENVAWCIDLHLDESGYPVALFSVQKNDGKYKWNKGKAGDDLRYHYARWDGESWSSYEIAFAGRCLYRKEDDYPGLAALNPDDLSEVVISTNSDPVTGEHLISEVNGKRHYELFRGKTSDGGANWTWTALTKNSTEDNIRPIIPYANGGPTVLLWNRGKMRTFTDYDLEIVAQKLD